MLNNIIILKNLDCIESDSYHKILILYSYTFIREYKKPTLFLVYDFYDSIRQMFKSLMITQIFCKQRRNVFYKSPFTT